MTYDDAEMTAVSMGYDVRQCKMTYHDGLVNGRRIYLRSGMTEAKKTDVLIEEVVHGEVTVGNILDQKSVNNRKQERFARKIVYEIRTPLIGIARAVNDGLTEPYEIADRLGCSEDTLREALEYYKDKYGAYVYIDNYMIQFIPYLYVYKPDEEI